MNARRTRRPFHWPAMIVAATLPVTGCGPLDHTHGPGDYTHEELAAMTVEFDREAAYMGSIEGADAMMVITVASNGFTDVYVCGGDATFATHSRWFCPDDLIGEGTVVDFERQGWVFTGELTDGHVVGTLAAPDDYSDRAGEGEVYEFDLAPLAADRQMATFQHSTGPNNCSGAIVWQDGDGPVEMVGTYCFDDRVIRQVTPILEAMPAPADPVIRVLAVDGDAASDVYLLNNELF